MTRKVTKEQNWPTPTRKTPCPVCENTIVVNLGMLITEALQKFGPLTQEDLERITAYMAHFRFCLGSEYDRGE
jgi:hypothetical protein